MEYTLDYLGSLADGHITSLSYPEVAANLYEPIKYTFATGGKRLRPALCLAVFSALSHKAPVEAINQAMAVEMFHNFTLLHDDVMDRADMRRGHPTVHVKWDLSSAILSGDTMLTLAYDLLSEGAGHHFEALFRLFSRTAMEVYQGQQLDMEFEKRNDVSTEEYMEMIKLKTSVLLGCACKLGAIMASAPTSAADSFYEYGLRLGLAFQMRDDWLDTFGDPKIFGKEIGGDIMCDKKTWLRTMAEAKAPEALAAIDSTDKADKIARTTELYRQLGLDEECRAKAMHYADTAIEALANVKLDADARRFFEDTARKAATREK